MASKSMFGDDSGFKKKGGGDEADLDITPMIDVTFLLLIFFMVTSTMQSQKDFEVPVAKHGVGVDSRGTSTIEVRAPSGGDPVIVIEGTEYSLDNIPTMVQEGVDKGALHVVIKADRNVPWGFVGKVSQKVVEVEGVTFSIGVRDE